MLEIGPGPGGLTRALLDAGARVAAIERDRDLAEGLRAALPAVTVVAGDALALDWHALVPAGAPIVGNIPYNITSPLLAKALTPPLPRVVIFLVQKEVADRVTAAPGTAAYGALSVGVQAVAHAERLFVVRAGAFHPPPKVDSAVLRLVPRAAPLVAEARGSAFRRFVVGLFAYRRKQLARGLRELLRWPPERVAATLARLGLDPTARPEVLAPSALASLFGACVDAVPGDG